MNVPAGSNVPLTVDFGTSFTGLTPGITIVGVNTASTLGRTTSGVVEVQAGTGIYLYQYEFGTFSGYVEWDTGTGAYAAEEVKTVNMPVAGHRALTLVANLGSSKTGLSTVTVSLRNSLNVEQQSANASEVADGIYIADVSVARTPPMFAFWSSGDSSPAYAADNVDLTEGSDLVALALTPVVPVPL